MRDSSSETAAIESPGSKSPSSVASLPKRRRRWVRWLVGAIAVLAVIVFFLPQIVALPALRGPLFSLLFPGLKVRVAVDELSLGWFSPIRAGGVRLESDAEQPAALTIDEIVGDASLWNVFTGNDLGGFRLVQPEVFVQFDQDGSNWGRLIGALQGAPKIERALRLEIVDAKISLQGPTAPQPWSLDKLSTSVAFSPAVDNPFGVPLLEGSKLALLDQAELTPELCDEMLKYIVPSFAGVTRTSGRVSLEVDQFSWPIGKPNEANVQGRLTLHSVDMGAGAIADSLAGTLEGFNLPGTLKVAQNDTVTFWVENGRVHHKDFAFGLIDLQPDRLIRTHGSVGFDQSLDLIVEVPIPRTALTATLDITGTLEQMTARPRLPADGNFAPAMKILGDLLERRQETRDSQPRPGLFRNRRRSTEETSRQK